jgi:hypothetical protein
MNNKVVARFVDGRTVKGTTMDFVPAKDFFHVLEVGAPPGAQAVLIRTNELKALFFVKDFAGNPDHAAVHELAPTPPAAGRRIKVVFKDGEVMLGTTTSYQPGRVGFFLERADAALNEERCFVLSEATQEVSFL